MLFLLALINLMMMGFFVWNTIKRGESDFFFWASLCVVFALPAVYDSWQNTDGSQDELLAKAFLFVLGMNCLFWMGKRCVSVKSPRRGQFVPLPRRLWMGLFCVQIAAVGVLAADIYISTGLWLWLAFAVDWHEVAFYNRTILNSIGLLLALVGSAACVVAWVQRRWFGFALSSLLTIFTTLLMGSRLFIAPAFTPIIFLGLTSRIRVRNFILAALAAGILIFLIYEIQTLRWSENRSLTNLFLPSAIQSTFERIATGNEKGDLELRSGFYFVIREMPRWFPFGNGQTYLRLLMFPVPTSLSGGLKPPEYTQQLYNYYYPHQADLGGTQHPLLYGDSYANFGVAGIGTGFLWGSLFGMLDRWLKRRPAWLATILLSPISCFAIFLARGAVYSSVVFLVYGSLLMLGFAVLGIGYSRMRLEG